MTLCIDVMGWKLKFCLVKSRNGFCFPFLCLSSRRPGIATEQANKRPVSCTRSFVAFSSRAFANERLLHRLLVAAPNRSGDESKALFIRRTNASSVVSNSLLIIWHSDLFISVMCRISKTKKTHSLYMW